MIKFFRKIRYDLMEKNKTGKYFKYAFGEIVLVVIGILIALSINNWNENRKNKLTESEYYCKLLADFKLDRQNIAVLYEESEHKIEISKRLLLELNNKNKDKPYLLNYYLQGLRTNAFVPSKVAMTDIVSSGKLNLLTNDSLKNDLLRYYGELDKLLYQLEINQSKSLERVFLYDEFQTDLVFFVTMSEREKQHYNNILKAMESTYNQLKRECNSK